jgi:outer membrane protein assembly factor BamB
MQKTRINTAIIALIAFVLMLTIVSASFTAVTFAAEDINGDRIIFPVPAWKRTGPSPWWCTSNGIIGNVSANAFNDYSPVPETPHVLWAHYWGTGGAVGGFNPSGGSYYGGTVPYGMVGGVTYSGKFYCINNAFSVGTQIICIDEETGEEVWVSQVVPSKTKNLQIMQHAISPGGSPTRTSVVIPSGKQIYFFDADTGALTNTVNFPRDITFMWVGWEDTMGVGTCSYGSSADQMYAYGITKRNEREEIAYCYWFGAFDNSIFSPPVLVWETKGAAGTIRSAGPDVLMCWSTAEQIFRGIDRFTGKTLFEIPFTSYNSPSVGYGKAYLAGEDQYMYSFDIHTGQLVWKSEIAMNSFTNQHGHCVGNGLVVVTNFDGNVYAFDAFTGKLVWRYYMGDCPFEPYYSWYGTWPTNQIASGGVGGFLVQSGDHLAHEPIPLGERLYVFNATTGVVKWSYPNAAHGGHDSHSPILADGIIFDHDGYTGQLFAFGKGPSGVTVSVPKAQIAKGEYTWITATVTDQSPGQPGTPCVSKADMGSWMEYLHSGMPLPPTKTGVPVTLYATSSSGTPITIDTVTTDGETGQFSTMWTPPTEDMYTISAVFDGDGSYWTSWGDTNLAVGPAPAVASITSSPTTATITIATLAAVVIGAIVIQKRPLKNSRKETEQ